MQGDFKRESSVSRLLNAISLSPFTVAIGRRREKVETRGGREENPKTTDSETSNSQQKQPKEQEQRKNSGEYKVRKVKIFEGCFLDDNILLLPDGKLVKPIDRIKVCDYQASTSTPCHSLQKLSQSRNSFAQTPGGRNETDTLPWTAPGLEEKFYEEKDEIFSAGKEPQELLKFGDVADIIKLKSEKSQSLKPPRRKLRPGRVYTSRQTTKKRRTTQSTQTVGQSSKVHSRGRSELEENLVNLIYHVRSLRRRLSEKQQLKFGDISTIKI